MALWGLFFGSAIGFHTTPGVVCDMKVSWVGEGIWTLDLLGHSEALCPLSYTHHIVFILTPFRRQNDALNNDNYDKAKSGYLRSCFSCFYQCGERKVLFCLLFCTHDSIVEPRFLVSGFCIPHAHRFSNLNDFCLRIRPSSSILFDISLYKSTFYSLISWWPWVFCIHPFCM